jgi:hypothetical protein
MRQGISIISLFSYIDCALLMAATILSCFILQIMSLLVLIIFLALVRDINF